MRELYMGLYMACFAAAMWCHACGTRHAASWAHAQPIMFHTIKFAVHMISLQLPMAGAVNNTELSYLIPDCASAPLPVL